MRPFIASHARSHPDVENAVAAYAMELRNGVVPDLSGGGDDLAMSGGFRQRSGLMGKSIEFNGVDGLGLSSDVVDLESDFTFACWLNLKVLTDGTFLSQGNSLSNNPYWYFRLQSGNIVAAIRDSSAVSGTITNTASVTDESWVHVACVREGDAFRTYVNKAVSSDEDISALGIIDVDRFAVGCLQRTVASSFSNSEVLGIVARQEAKDQTWVSEQYNLGRRALWKTNPVNNTVATVVGGASKPFIGDSPFRGPSGQWDIVDDTVETENAKVIECISAGNLEFPQALLGEGIGEDDNWRGWIDTGAGYVEGAISTTSRILAMATGDKISIGALSGNYSVIKDLLA